MVQTSIALVGHGLTLLAVIGGFILTKRGQDKSYRTVVVARQRQEWIDRIRGLTAEVIGARDIARGNAGMIDRIMNSADGLSRGKEKDEIPENAEIAVLNWLIQHLHAQLDAIARAHKASHELRILLDPDDKEQQELAALVRSIAIGLDETEEEKQYKLREQAITRAHTILKNKQRALDTDR